MTLVNSRMVRGRCPCGAEHAACGPPSTSTPVDENLEVAVVGGALEKYTVILPGGRETVMKLNEADAARYGVAKAPKAEEPAEQETSETPAKKRTPANKSRAAATKADSGGDN